MEQGQLPMTQILSKVSASAGSSCAFLVACAILLAPGPVVAQLAEKFDLARPGDREFVLDEANLIDAADEQKIKQLADRLLTDKAVPIIVVTIESMARHGGEGVRIESFARLLFDQWGIGPEKLGDTTWNYGILLLVSRDDHLARIELGAGWRRDKDDVARKIMEEQIIPRFKQGDFSGGIVEGVGTLDRMARDLQLPSRHSQPTPRSHYIIGAVFFGLAVFTVVSLIRRGSSGWAWIMWGLVFGIIGAILYHMATSRSGGSGSGGYSGGSFGGGFSGGGGSTGSW
jgi:uncharacterized protein